MRAIRPILLLFIFAISIFPKTVTSQVTCPITKIIGEWYYYTAFDPVDKINVDSLKGLVTDTTKFLAKLIFMENGKCLSDYKGKLMKPQPYRLDHGNCKIIFGKKKKPRYSSIATIEYLDEKCLLYTKWNPHGPMTIFYYRK